MVGQGGCTEPVFTSYFTSICRWARTRPTDDATLKKCGTLQASDIPWDALSTHNCLYILPTQVNCDQSPRVIISIFASSSSLTKIPSCGYTCEMQMVHRQKLYNLAVAREKFTFITTAWQRLLRSIGNWRGAIFQSNLMLWIVGGIRLRLEYAPNFYRVHKAQYNKVLDGLAFHSLKWKAKQNTRTTRRRKKKKVARNSWVLLNCECVGG